MITVDDKLLHILFKHPWTAQAYETFLRSKKLPEHRIEYRFADDSYELTAPARFAPLLGVQPHAARGAGLPIADHLFDYQRFLVDTALKAQRYAIWADTGLGKTAMFLEWARHVHHRTDGKVMILSPLNIIPQTMEESAKFYGNAFLACAHLESRADMIAWLQSGETPLAITNYEKFIAREGEGEIVSELRLLSGIVLDESSILKSGGGRIKWSLIKSARGIEYKLSCTATPAPNDTMEYASQAAFLEKLRNEGEILWTFFTRDGENNWVVKRHAEEAFYRFMSGWSVYLRNPAHYGFADNLKDLPPPEIFQHEIPMTEAQRDATTHMPSATGQLSMFVGAKLDMTERAKMSQVAKGFMYHGGKTPERIESRKPAFVADLIREETRAGLQVLVWTVFDEESAILAEHLKGVEGVDILTGAVPQVKRVPIIERFRRGESRALITRASILGHGLNFQNCGSMIFSGFDDSFERFYQAVRRAYRYGQTRSVRVHIPFIRELEGAVWENVQSKQSQFLADCERMERNYLRVMKEMLHVA